MTKAKGGATTVHATTRISGPVLYAVKLYIADSTNKELNTRRVIDAAVIAWLAQQRNARAA